jgi:hypothetical protein
MANWLEDQADSNLGQVIADIRTFFEPVLLKSRTFSLHWKNGWN